MLHARARRLIEPVYDAKERELDVVSRTLISLFEQLVKQSRKLPPEVLASLSGIDDPSRVADSASPRIFRCAWRTSRKCWKPPMSAQRLELLIGLVESEMDLQQVEKRIRGRVKSQMEKSQREYYLNEQMKAIQKELGDLEEGAERDRGAAARRSKPSGMPKPVLAKARQEFGKLKHDVADVGGSHRRAQLSRLAGRRAVEKAQQGAQGSADGAAGARRRITSAWKRSRNASSNISPCSSA